MAKKKQARAAEQKQDIALPLHTDNRYAMHGRPIGSAVTRKIGKYHAIALCYDTKQWRVAEWVDNGPSTVIVGGKTINVSRDDRAGSLGKRAQSGVLGIVVSGKQIAISKANKASDRKANEAFGIALSEKYPNGVIVRCAPENWRSA